MKRFRVEYCGDAPNSGGWRNTISSEGRDGFDTREDAEKYAEIQRNRNKHILLYRVVDTLDNPVEIV